MRKLLTSSILLCAALCSVYGEDAADDLLEVVRSDRVIYSGESSWKTNHWFLAGGISGSELRLSLPRSAESEAAPDYELVGLEYGLQFETVPPDICLGDFLTDIPSDVNWEATVAGIQSSPSYSSGIITVFPSAQEAKKRILFTGGGIAEITWVKNNSDPETLKYPVARSCSNRPRRIFWTSEPYNAPPVNLSGRFVQLYGAPDIVKPVWETDSASMTSNIVRGVYLDTYSKTLQAVARRGENGKYEGPEGQFVVAYYDNGDFDDIVSITVVEVSRPDVLGMSAHVGERLRPYGGGYDTDGLYAYVQKGATSITTDPSSPYLEIFTAKSKYNKKNGAVYAIAPTDDTSTSNGESADWHAEIYWEAPDAMDTLWPFEADWYHISWNPDDPRMVVPDVKSDTGVPIYIPTNYTATISDYMKPDNCAEFDTENNAVKVKEPGRFLIKLRLDDDVRYLPVQAFSRKDPAVSTGKDIDLYARVGQALWLPSVFEAGSLTNEVQLMDKSVPGYIYKSADASAAGNWNPHFYHEPEPQTAAAALSQIGSSATESDVFETLKSSICPVAASNNPIEVWWYRSMTSYGGEDFPAPVRIPGVVFRYAAEMPSPQDCHEIALVSQKGSGALSLSTDGAAVFFEDDQASVSAYDDPIELDADEKVSFGIWVNASPFDAGRPEANEGRLATVYAGTNIVWKLDASDVGFDKKNTWIHYACSVDGAVDGRRNVYVIRDGSWVATNSIPSPDGEMTITSFMIGADTNTVANAASSAATGWAVDEFTCWNTELTTNLVKSLFVDNGYSSELESAERFVFDADCIVTEYGISTVPSAGDAYYMKDTKNRGHYMTIFGEIARMKPGAPHLSGGFLAAEGGAVPRVYRQTDKDVPGFRLNLEHALTSSEDGVNYVAWALRTDLRKEPYVLVEYSKNGEGAMAVYNVVITNDMYNSAMSHVIVANQMLPPKPLCLVDGYWNENTSYAIEELDGDSDCAVVFRDRKLNDWARRDGRCWAFYFYKVADTFDFPRASKVPQTGEYIGWNNLTGEIPAYRDLKLYELIMGRRPMPWQWTSEFEPVSSAKKMKVGQTLTKAQDGLPEVWNMASCAVVFPLPGRTRDFDADHKKQPANVVDLIDPTTVQTAPLEIGGSFTEQYGFKLGSSGDCMLRKGKYYFTGLPPSISDRFYIDTSASASRRMCLAGELVEPATGNPYLRINTLTDAEAEQIKSICHKTDYAWTNWVNAVNILRGKPAICPSRVVSANGKIIFNCSDLGETVTTNGTCVVDTYDPADHYALMANGNDSGWVVIVENNSDNTDMVAEGDPVNLQAIYVENELYNGTISTQTDPLNKLSELLTVQYNEAFGTSTANFVFEWRSASPLADGSIPTDYLNDGNWPVKHREEGLTSFLIGTTGTTLAELVNKYWVMRYRAKEGTAAYLTCGGGWSDWTKPALAEGWVQRVLNAITPFAQRVEDFYNNPSDIAYTMFEQIGKPYRGDVALNNDNLTEVGLLELYQTIFNKAEKMSLSLGYSDADVCKQLMLAATRMNEFYQLLGGEAYADAKNPLISQGNNSKYLEEIQILPSSTFCFQNQVATLLDEELALLRGRSNATQAPDMTTQPVYNRLYWNLTKGITEGEVAYVNNYGIRATDGVLGVDQAAAQYPQGHGDAWGHYLSGLTVYYRLLRNPYFHWQAAMGEMNLSQTVVNEDYYDEQKFADTALKLAQTGLDVVDLTARKAWRDQGGETYTNAYADVAQNVYPNASNARVTVQQGFGYGEWASRAGQGALYNWMIGNAMLPTNASPAEVYGDQGLKRLTRPTATQLEELATIANSIQQKVNTLDSGLNPLGLSNNAIPMDIDPSQLEEKNSHFDQILERAEKALRNCSAVLDFANQYGSRLALIGNAETEDSEDADEMERTFNNQLIAIYGTPYSGDIGTGKTYPQGYDGPDLYHYMWMDVDDYGLSTNDLRKSAILTNLTSYTVFGATRGIGSNSVTVINYEIAPDGIVLKPENIGFRYTEGSLQAAYREYLACYASATKTLNSYEKKVKQMDDKAKRYYKSYALKDTSLTMKNASDIILKGLKVANKITTSTAEGTLDVGEFTEGLAGLFGEAIPVLQVAGTAVSMSPRAVAAMALSNAVAAESLSGLAAKTTARVSDLGVNIADLVMTGVQDVFDWGVALWENEVATEDKYQELVKDVNSVAKTLQTEIGALSAAEAAYRAEVAKGDALQEEREVWRKRVSNKATMCRYADMYNRVQRNNALTKYSTSFDTAQRYVWELAKVYDYETGLLSSDRAAGDKFLAEVIGSRQLGNEGISVSSAQDKGLYDIVNRMKENWAVLKGRLGVNNPDNTTTEFSLRYELFRIRKDAAGDEAWRQELRKYWVDNILADSDFRRYCQPPANANVSVLNEPGLIIPFSTAINNAENFFGRTLQGGDHAFSSADYATKIHSIGVGFDGYDNLVVQTVNGLAANPNVYLVPVGLDYMRAPAGTERKVLAWRVIDQVLPLPYTVGSTELDDVDWISTFNGTDGTSDSYATIRRHSTLRADGNIYSTRLVGRSVWNDRWLLVIPASALNANREKGLETFINGVNDIKLSIRAYARSGN